jgi:hypothetical protein
MLNRENGSNLPPPCVSLIDAIDASSTDISHDMSKLATIA